MTTQRMEHVEDLIGGYLLGALEEDERERVSAHLDDCPACLALYEQSRELLAVLPDELDELAPRPHVKAQLLAAAGDQNRQEQPRSIVNLGEERQRRLSFGQWAPLGAAAAAVIAIVVGLTAWALVLNNRLDDRDAELARVQDLVGAVTTSGQVLTMEGTEAAPQVHAALIVPSDGDGVFVLANNVPQPDEGTGYHLWLFDDDQPVSGGVLTPDDEGTVAVRIAGVDLSQFERMEVDVQPLGSDAPGGTTVLGGELN
jgi:anti-sigma-K factor RskA